MSIFFLDYVNIYVNFFFVNCTKPSLPIITIQLPLHGNSYSPWSKRPFTEITTSKFVNSCQLLTKTEVTVSELELEGSILLVVIVLSNYSNKSGSK